MAGVREEKRLKIQDEAPHTLLHSWQGQKQPNVLLAAQHRHPEREMGGYRYSTDDAYLSSDKKDREFRRWSRGMRHTNGGQRSLYEEKLLVFRLSWTGAGKRQRLCLCVNTYNWMSLTLDHSCNLLFSYAGFVLFFDFSLAFFLLFGCF